MNDPLQNVHGHHDKHNDLTSSPYEGKKLFTPGPLNTSATVRRAMLRDVGSRTEEMKSNIAWIRKKLVEIADLPNDKFTCVPMQGSGSFTVEAVLNTTSKKDGSARILIIVNGRYGKRMVRMCECMGLNVHALELHESKAVNAEIVQEFLERDSDWTSVGIVHSETSTGLFNDVEEVGRIIKEKCPGSLYIVDAMSSFGAVPLDMESGHVDFLVSSANKCIEGVPGFGYTICRKDALLQCEGRSSSVCLDIVDQYLILEKAGTFRFTPPTHSLLAFRQAIEEFLKEGGVNGRAKRYKELHRILCEGMEQLGFERYIRSESHGYIITSFIYPRHPNWSFEKFNDGLLRLGQAIYPGSTTEDVRTFRVGSIGQLCPADMSHLIECMKKVLRDMDIPVPVY